MDADGQTFDAGSLGRAADLHPQGNGRRARVKRRVRRDHLGHSVTRAAAACAVLLLTLVLASCGSSERGTVTTATEQPTAAQARGKAAVGHAHAAHVPRKALMSASTWIVRARRDYARGTYRLLRLGGRLSLLGARLARADLLHAQRILMRWSSPLLTATRAAGERLARLKTNRRQRQPQAFAINASLAALVQETTALKRH